MANKDSGELIKFQLPQCKKKSKKNEDKSSKNLERWLEQDSTTSELRKAFLRDSSTLYNRSLHGESARWSDASKPLHQILIALHTKDLMSTPLGDEVNRYNQRYTFILTESFSIMQYNAFESYYLENSSEMTSFRIFSNINV